MNERAGAAAPICWVVSDGKVGMEVQCRGLAEALGVDPVVKRIDVRPPWRWLPPRFNRDPLAHTTADADSLAPPWPDILIASGRQTVAVSITIRRLSGGRTFTVQVQNPVVDPGQFDVVVAPRHDRLSGANVVTTTGSLNRVTAARLCAAAAEFGPRLRHLPQPRIAVLIGGNSKVHRFSAAAAWHLGEQLAALAQREKLGLLVTPSRRTGDANNAILRQALAGTATEIWDGTGENPYYGYLALAETIVVTGDSVNMVSEAATTGKPVYIVDLAGGSAKFRRFHATMQAEGITRPFTGILEHWTYTPLRDTQHAAAEILQRLAARSSGERVSRPAAGQLD